MMSLRSIMYRTFLVLILFCLTSCGVRSIDLGFSPQQWQTITPVKRRELQESYYKIRSLTFKTVYQGPNILVTLFGGTVLMPPFFQTYYFKLVKFKSAPGECQHVQLMSLDQTHFVELTVCYDGLTLSIDPSRYDLEKARGTLFLTYNPLWKNGFTYNGLSSAGYVRLKNVSITVKTN